MITPLSQYDLTSVDICLFIDLFSVDERSGVIRVAGNLTLDYVPFYDLRIEAYDLGSPRRSSVCRARISVVDQNTHKPEFHQTEFDLRIAESKDNCHFPLIVHLFKVCIFDISN